MDKRYQVIRESDNRYVVLDMKSDGHPCVSGPTANYLAARRDADRRNTSWNAARQEGGH